MVYHNEVIQKINNILTVNSDISEAALYEHLRGIVEDIKNMQYDSWRKKCYTDWEEEHPVEIEIKEI